MIYHIRRIFYTSYSGYKILKWFVVFHSKYLKREKFFRKISKSGLLLTEKSWRTTTLQPCEYYSYIPFPSLQINLTLHGQYLIKRPLEGERRVSGRYLSRIFNLKKYPYFADIFLE